MEPAKIIARFADGRVLKGQTHDFSPEAPRFHLLPVPSGAKPRPVEVALSELKALFFVRDFAGNREYREHREFRDHGRRSGRRVEVEFGDGEVIVGYTMGYDPARAGFFLFPADARSNNLRVFAVSAAIRHVRPAGPRPSVADVPVIPPATGGSMVDPKLVSNLQTVVTVLRQAVTDWEQLVRAVDALGQEHAALRARCEGLERELETFRAAHASLADAHRQALATAEELRAAHAALGTEHEKVVRTLDEVSGRCDAAVRERQATVDELAMLLRRLQG
jgi:hypothetical protein